MNSTVDKEAASSLLIKFERLDTSSPTAVDRFIQDVQRVGFPFTNTVLKKVLLNSNVGDSGHPFRKLLRSQITQSSAASGLSDDRLLRWDDNVAAEFRSIFPPDEFEVVYHKVLFFEEYALNGRGMPTRDSNDWYKIIFEKIIEKKLKAEGYVLLLKKLLAVAMQKGKEAQFLNVVRRLFHPMICAQVESALYQILKTLPSREEVEAQRARDLATVLAEARNTLERDRGRGGELYISAGTTTDSIINLARQSLEFDGWTFLRIEDGGREGRFLIMRPSTQAIRELIEWREEELYRRIDMEIKAKNRVPRPGDSVIDFLPGFWEVRVGVLDYSNEMIETVIQKLKRDSFYRFLDFEIDEGVEYMQYKFLIIKKPSF